MNTLSDDSFELCPGMTVLRRFADTALLQTSLQHVVARSPLRRMQTRRGLLMSVKTTNCGSVGWVADRRGYRYEALDPLTQQSWPPMPESFMKLAQQAADECGYSAFVPDACLVNVYQPGTQMGAHQDKDERDFTQPIVSVSMGIPARFFVQGAEPRGRALFADLHDGDVVVFGGPARRYYHGVRRLKEAHHDVLGATRWNLTFRRAL